MRRTPTGKPGDFDKEEWAIEDEVEGATEEEEDWEVVRVAGWEDERGGEEWEGEREGGRDEWGEGRVVVELVAGSEASFYIFNKINKI